MSNWEWLYQQNAKRRRQSQMQLRMQAEQQNIQNFLLLNTDTMTYMAGSDTSGSYGFGESDHLLGIDNKGGLVFTSAQDFCIEWFQYHYDTPHTEESTVFSINELSKFGVSFRSNLLTLYIGSSTPIIQVDFEEEQYTNRWMHIAICRKDGVIYIYKNGLRVYSGNNTSAQTDGVNIMTIGSTEFDRETHLFDGLLTNMRYAVGNSIYDGSLNITCPTSPLQDTTGVKFILNAMFQDPFKDSSSNNRTVKALGSVERYQESPFPFFNPEIFPPVHHVLRYDFSNLDSYPGTGATVTDIKNGTDGKLFNSPVYTGTGPKYMEFDGTNQYLGTMTNLASYFIGTEKVTLSMWAYPMDNGVLLSERGSTSLSSGWHDAQIAVVGGTAKFGMWSPLGMTSITSSIPTPINNWYNLVLKYDNAIMTAYVNGATAGTLTFDRLAPVIEGTGLYYTIAAADTTSMGDTTYANMRLGSFDVHKIDLSYEEILAEFEATRSRFGI